MKREFSRAISIVVALLLCFTSFNFGSLPTYAADDEDYIEIYTVADLYAVRNDLSANYRLMNDIDLTEATAPGGDYDYMGNGWDPIGSGGVYGKNPFTGTFDGQHHKISGMRIDIGSLPEGAGTSLYLGLFSYINGSHRIRNLAIEDCSINFFSKWNNITCCVGALAGCSQSINNCSSSGNITVDYSQRNGKAFIGGLVGDLSWAVSNERSYNCSSSCNISSVISRAVSHNLYVGGLAGTGSRICDSFSNGQVVCKIVGLQSNEQNSIRIGGLLGNGAYLERDYSTSPLTVNYVSGSGSPSGTINVGGVAGTSYGTIDDCYWNGAMNVSDINCYKGGITGKEYDSSNNYFVKINNCYSVGSAGAGIIGQASSYTTINNCYYLSGTSNAGAVQLSEAQMKLQSSFQGFDFDTTWFILDKGSYLYPQLISNPQDDRYVVDEIELLSPPDKISYYTDENVDVTGGLINVYYRGGSHETLPITQDMISPRSFSEAGVHTVTVTYKGKTVTFDVNVSPMPNVLSMELTSPPDKTEFVRGTEFDFTGCQATVYYDNNTTEVIDVRAEDTTGGNINSLGTQTIRFSYRGFTVEFQVTVIGVRPTGIEISNLPDKIEYLEGEEIDLTGLVVKELFNNGEEQVVTNYGIEGFSDEPGTHTITVTYDGFTATFDVTVHEKSLTSITITTPPLKTEYVLGQSFDANGMVVTATYDNGTTEVVTDYTVGPMPTEVGTHRIEISYGGKSAYIVVKITQKTMTSISIQSLPKKTTYAEDEDFQTDGLIVCANYNDGSSVPIDDYTLSGIDTSTIGEKKATVLYNGKTATFNYTVIAKVLEYISVTEPAKTIYVEGEEFDPTGMIVTAYYNNGKNYEVEDYTVTGYSGTPGTNIITVTYGDQSFSFPVNVYTPASEWTILLAPTCTEPGTRVLYDISGTVVLKVETIEALGHTVVGDEGHPATCLEDGLTDGSHCSTCGLVFEAQEVIPATGHTPASEWTTVLEPTCTEDGTQVKYCVTCGQVVETQPKSAVGHRPVIDEEVPATCTSSGTTSGTHCEVCGLVLTAPTVIPPLGHAWSSGTVTTQPTCTTPGIKTFTCLRCSEQKTETILALDHDFEEEWTIDKEATCTEDGLKSHHCTRCDAVKDDTVIRHLGHSFTNYVSNNDATCTEDGTKTAKCDRCEETSTITDVGSVKGHLVVTDPEVPAKCTETGLTEGSHCSVCGIVLVAQTIVPALGHSLNHVEAVSATCETEGNVEYWSCGTCGHYYSNSDASTEITIADTVIPATGHVHITGTESKAPSCETVGNIAYWTCEDCGKIFSDAEATTVITLADTVIPATGHVHLTATEALSPTCETAGNTAYWTCEDCGKIFSDATATAVIALADTVIPATGHVHLTATAAQAPTCSAAGNIAYWTCDACGKYFADAEGTTVITADDTVVAIDPDAHAWGDWHVTVEPKCETEGEETRVCAYDSSHFETRPVAALGHDWDEGVVIKEPTYWEEGLMLYTCRHDPSHTYTEAIPMLEKPSENEMIRIYGPNRSATAIEAANHLKEKNGIDKFDSIIIASGTGFPDALSASYLAYKKDGPILLVDNSSISTVSDYVNENLADNGTVYIVGGKGAVPLTVDENIIAIHGDEAILRLAGSDRYATNILVLNEAGVDGEDMLIASGTGFADALSASAAKRPILLVGASLSSDQIKYLSDNAGKLTGKYYVIGGKAAVSLEIENAIGGYGTVKRLSGSNRYATSIAVADEFFPGNVSTVVIANGMNFPDGLSGGPIAAAYDAPLVLLVDNTADHAKKLFKDKGAFRLIIMGGKGVISDGTAEMIAYQ